MPRMTHEGVALADLDCDGRREELGGLLAVGEVVLADRGEGDHAEVPLA